jgi:preprotein translocase subunit SecF
VHFFKATNIDFIENRYKFFVITGLLLVFTVGALIFRGGPNLGIDFKGGILVQVSFQNDIKLQDIRSALDNGGINSFELQNSGNTVMIRAKHEMQSQDAFVDAVKKSFLTNFPTNSLNIDRVEYVGPTVGAYLSKQALMAFLFAFLGMVIYVACRFKAAVWGISAVIGIIHDLFITFGFVVIVNKEIDITVIAALLTIAGYSINDTIVLFDRIRENLKLVAKENFAVVINKSINAVLGRTIVTSVTVFFVSTALFFFGGEVIHTFAYIMLIGTVIGTFSTVFLCSPIVYEWDTRKKARLDAAIKQGYVTRRK